MHVFSTNQIQRMLSNTNLDSFNIGNLSVFSVMDTFGCYELRHAEPYWKALLAQTYTIKDIVALFEGGKGNPLVKKGLVTLSKRIPSDQPVSYRATFLAKKPELLGDPEVPGIHIICLDKYGAQSLHDRYQSKLVNVSDSVVEKLKDNQKKYLTGLVLLDAKPGINLLLSCSQSDIINVLNNDALNTEKGPAKGYYYLGFDRNVYYFKNTIIMTASNNYLDLPPTYVHYSLNKNNTPVTYLNRVNKGIHSRIMNTLKEGAVLFTTEDLKRKLNNMVACIVTAEYRTKQPIVPNDVGVFKLEDGTPYELELFGKNLTTNVLKNQRVVGSLSEDANLQSFVQPRINTRKLREMNYKRYYEEEVAKRPALAPYLENIPTYVDKVERIYHLPFMQDETLAEDLRYEKDYTNFLIKHTRELEAIHPAIWDYINLQRSGSLLKRLQHIQKLLGMPVEEAQEIVTTWIHNQKILEEKEQREREIQRIIEEEEYNNRYNRYNSNNSNNYGYRYGNR